MKVRIGGESIEYKQHGRMAGRYRAYRHPHDPTVCVVDRLDADGALVATWCVAWSERPWSSVWGDEA